MKWRVDELLMTAPSIENQDFQIAGLWVICFHSVPQLNQPTNFIHSLTSLIQRQININKTKRD